MDGFILYKTNDEPIDISTFMIIFDNKKGINLYKESLKTYLNLPLNKVVELIHSKKNNEEENGIWGGKFLGTRVRDWRKNERGTMSLFVFLVGLGNNVLGLFRMLNFY